MLLVFLFISSPPPPPQQNCLPRKISLRFIFTLNAIDLSFFFPSHLGMGFREMHITLSSNRNRMCLFAYTPACVERFVIILTRHNFLLFDLFSSVKRNSLLHQCRKGVRCDRHLSTLRSSSETSNLLLEVINDNGQLFASVGKCVFGRVGREYAVITYMRSESVNRTIATWLLWSVKLETINARRTDSLEPRLNVLEPHSV